MWHYFLLVQSGFSVPEYLFCIKNIWLIGTWIMQRKYRWYFMDQTRKNTSITEHCAWKRLCVTASRYKGRVLQRYSRKLRAVLSSHCIEMKVSFNMVQEMTDFTVTLIKNNSAIYFLGSINTLKIHIHEIIVFAMVFFIILITSQLQRSAKDSLSRTWFQWKVSHLRYYRLGRCLLLTTMVCWLTRFVWTNKWRSRTDEKFCV